MNKIKPVSDLGNNFAKISKALHGEKIPVFLTKNGYGDMVVMSMDAYENQHFESEVYSNLLKAKKRSFCDKQAPFPMHYRSIYQRVRWRMNTGDYG